MQVKGVIFDMDGTLVDSLMFWGHLWRKIGERYMKNPDFLPPDEVARAIRTMIYADAMAYVHGACGIPCEREEFLRFTNDGLTSFYRDVATPKAGALALLADLKAAGMPMVLASATAKRELVYALDLYGMLPYFDAVLSCAEIGAGKDKPDIYLMAAKALGCAPCELCVVEDSYVALETARAAGFRTVGVFDPYTVGQERLSAAADIYLAEGETLTALIGELRA